jgi:integrase
VPLTVTKRKDTGGSLTIVGVVAGQRIRRRAQSNSLAIAREEAAALEAEILRTEWHGERRGARSLDEALVNYLNAVPRSEGTKRKLKRIRDALGGDAQLSSIGQDVMARLRQTTLRASAGAATYLREIVTPISAVLRHAADLGWCDPPRFKRPKPSAGRTRYLNPEEAERLVNCAAPHVRPLLVFLLGTGARMSEALELDWRDVDLAGGRAIFWRTKNGNRRVAALNPSGIEALANLPGRSGSAFRTADGRSYANHDRAYGGQIKTAWRTAIRKAGLDRELTPHDLRHTWASWHYALNRDLLALKAEGGWSSVTLVERYAHLMPAGHEAAIRRFWGIAEQREERVA